MSPPPVQEGKPAVIACFVFHDRFDILQRDVVSSVHLEGDSFAAIREERRLVGCECQKSLIGAIHPFPREEPAPDGASKKIETCMSLLENVPSLMIIPAEA